MAKKGATKGKAQSEPPKLQLLLLCDAISRDPNSNKATAYGIFDRVRGDSFPVRVGFAMHAKFFGGRGKNKISIEIADSKGKSLFKDKLPTFELDCQPNVTIDIDARIEGVPFPASDVYSITAIADGRSLGDGYRIVVDEKK